MANGGEIISKADGLAREVITLSRDRLLVDMRFLDMAVSGFELRAYPGIIATDGELFFYDAYHVLHCYKQEPNRCIRDYLHTVLHCVFSHLFAGEGVDPRRWDCACDIAVESVINELSPASLRCHREEFQRDIIKEYRERIGNLTAEKLYRCIVDDDMSDDAVYRLRAHFVADDHRPWRLYTKEGDEGDDSGNQNRAQHDSISRKKRNKASGGKNAANDTKGKLSRREREITSKWKKISRRMQIELETMSKQHGDSAKGLVQSLLYVNREKYDYTEFLKRFSTMGEVVQINDDEFDTIFYTYGLSLYENMPLIEALEYKEVKRIKEFVIAIDTSASVSGDLVRRFVSKTYEILSSSESFFNKINLHIIQCDAEIQSDEVITCREEMEKYIDTMQLKGFGGTDFRPVFAYVDELVKKGSFTNLKGLIYFTDGRGEYPVMQPNYISAFVFLEDDAEAPKVPVWAIKLVLNSDEI